MHEWRLLPEKAVVRTDDVNETTSESVFSLFYCNVYTLQHANIFEFRRGWVWWSR